MQFLDRAKIFLSSGSGGNGCVSFRRERNIEFGGPDGGNGGRGGHIYLRASKDLTTLIDFRYHQHFKAPRGQHGSGRDQAGKAGEDLIIPVPVGTEIWDATNHILLADLTMDQQQILLLKGGNGGHGNSFFKSATNRAPKFASPGQPGKEMWVNLRLKLLADIGIVGLPNAGKSTLLAALTRAHPKIGAYPFTTLSPQLGVLRVGDKDYVLADLPGLIEDAHQGKGLGLRFLSHAERCRALLHLIDITSEDVCHDYAIIRSELLAYHASFAEKQEIIVLNKMELLPPEEVMQKKQQLEALTNHPVFLISAAANQGLKPLTYYIDQVLMALESDPPGPPSSEPPT